MEKNIILKDCTVLVNSCDAYSDIWDAFFSLMEKYWPDRPWPVVLNTETKSYTREHTDIRVIHSDKDISWSDRLRRVLNLIESDYILFMLDDFFLMDYVDTRRVEECLEWIKKDSRVASFTFWPVSWDGKTGNYKGFQLRRHDGRNIVTATLALWSKEKLLSYLEPGENAWQFEAMGTKRSYERDDDFYVMHDIKPYVFPYSFVEIGLFSGQWLKKTVSFLKKTG